MRVEGKLTFSRQEVLDMFEKATRERFPNCKIKVVPKVNAQPFSPYLRYEGDCGAYSFDGLTVEIVEP